MYTAYVDMTPIDEFFLQELGYFANKDRAVDACLNWIKDYDESVTKEALAESREELKTKNSCQLIAQMCFSIPFYVSISEETFNEVHKRLQQEYMEENELTEEDMKSHR